MNNCVLTANNLLHIGLRSISFRHYTRAPEGSGLDQYSIKRNRSIGFTFSINQTVRARPFDQFSSI